MKSPGMTCAEMGIIRRAARRVPGARPVYARLKRTLAWARFLADFRRFRGQAGRRRMPVRWADRYPCLDDATATTPFDKHYIYHTAWAARVLARLRPARHVDISSSLYFSAIASAVVPMDVYDYRPPRLSLDNVKVDRADLVALPFSSSRLALMHACR